MRDLVKDIITEIFINFSRFYSTFNQTISQQILSYHNSEEDYLCFLNQYLRVLTILKQNRDFYRHFRFYSIFAEEDFKDAVFFFRCSYPDFVEPLIRLTHEFLFMETPVIDHYIWRNNLFYCIPLAFFFFKSYLYVSIVSLTTLNTYVLGDISLYFEFLYELFLKYDTLEELRIIFILLNFYNFDFFLNLFFFSLKYNIYPFFICLNNSKEYFFIPLGLFINFIIAFLLLFLVFIINRGTVISDLEKTSAYECGFDPFKDSRQLTDINFFRVAILFILFDLEIIYLIPWIFILYASFYNYYIIVGGFCYLFILSLGLFFEYKSKILDW